MTFSIDIAVIFNNERRLKAVNYYEAKGNLSISYVICDFGHQPTQNFPRCSYNKQLSCLQLIKFYSSNIFLANKRFFNMLLKLKFFQSLNLFQLLFGCLYHSLRMFFLAVVLKAMFSCIHHIEITNETGSLHISKRLELSNHRKIRKKNNSE